MALDLDDDFDKVSDFNMSESESDCNSELERSTPITAPHTPTALRLSQLKTIECPYENCCKTFNRKARLTEHLRSHTNTRPFKCTFAPCTKDFLRDSHLKHHVKSAHSDVRDYKCTKDGCSKSFATGTRLRRHEAAHDGQEKFMCRGYADCSQTFRKHDTLKRHILSVHQHTKPFPCPEVGRENGEKCAKAFDTAERLRAHRRSKHDRFKYACSECLQQLPDEDVQRDEALSSTYFTTYTDLQSHIATIHPPICSYCPISFSTSKELTRHLDLIHGITDPSSAPAPENFACPAPGCMRSFSRRGNLNVHVKTVHEKRRDFVCGETEVHLVEVVDSTLEIYGCGRDFTSKASLEEHIRTAHLGVGSRRTARENKRKAGRDSAGESEEDVEVGTESKKRRPRKDKGVKKTSFLAELTGVPVSYDSTPTFLQSFGQYPSEFRILAQRPARAYPSQNGYQSRENYNILDHGDLSESGFLDGSTTIYGNQIFQHDTGRRDQFVDSNMSQPGNVEPASLARVEQAATDAFRHSAIDADMTGKIKAEASHEVLYEGVWHSSLDLSSVDPQLLPA